MSAWDRLLARALDGFDRLSGDGTPVPRWALGGGTALMLHAWHRSSKDVDLFIDDPQYLGLLSPRLNDALATGATAYDEAAHYIKLHYADGEIDVIVSPALSRQQNTTIEFHGREVPVESPVEIALKKLWHRGAQLLARDIFDIAVVAQDHGAALRAELDVLVPVKPALAARLAAFELDWVRKSLDGLDIYPHWAWLKPQALPVVRDLVDAIPDCARDRAPAAAPPAACRAAVPSEAAAAYLHAMAAAKIVLREAKAAGDQDGYARLARQRRDLSVQAVALGLAPLIRAVDPAAADRAERLARRSDAEVLDRAARTVPDPAADPDGPEM